MLTIRHSRYSYAFFIFIFSLQYCQVTDSIRWLALSHAKHPWNESRHCPQSRQSRKAYGLVGFQTKLCKRHAQLMPTIMRSVLDTLTVCQVQFHDRRWNCSSAQFAPRLTPDLTKGTREQAFVYSLSSAAIAHGVAKACSNGQLNYCPCGPSPNEVGADFKWKGCSDNVQYGIKVSQEWADSPWSRKNGRRVARELSRLIESGRYAGNGKGNGMTIGDVNYANSLTPRARMNQHNNDVGRIIVSQSLEPKCKCHGVSGSCSMKTCWKVVPDLMKIGEILKEKYNRATEVRTRSEKAPRMDFEPVALMGRLSPDVLVFMRKSPDYCTEDRRVGSLGTRGRFCNASENTHSSCDSMCCGRGYETFEVETISNCECRYVHCCEVICKKCRDIMKKHYCK